MTQPILSAVLIFAACALYGPGVLPLDAEGDIDAAALEAAHTAFGANEDLDAAITSFASACSVTPDMAAWLDAANSFVTSEDGKWPGKLVDATLTCEGYSVTLKVQAGAVSRAIHVDGWPPAVDMAAKRIAAVLINGSEERDGNNGSEGRVVRSKDIDATTRSYFTPADDGSEPVETA